MSQQTVIDTHKFAIEQKSLSGELAILELKRLHDLLIKTEGNLSFVLSGRLGDHRQVCLNLQVSGVLHLVCQRCMNELPYSLNFQVELEMIPEGEEITQDELEDDSKDYLPWTKLLNVSELVEDEVILALPVVARHSVCNLQGRAEAGDLNSPFAGLATLKTGLN